MKQKKDCYDCYLISFFFPMLIPNTDKSKEEMEINKKHSLVYFQKDIKEVKKM